MESKQNLITGKFIAHRYCHVSGYVTTNTAVSRCKSYIPEGQSDRLPTSATRMDYHGDWSRYRNEGREIRVKKPLKRLKIRARKIIESENYASKYGNMV
jgi:hypothetical protein